MTFETDKSANPPASQQQPEWRAKDVAVVLLNFNGADDTLACLESLAVLQSTPGAIYVVDNASGDDSAERIRQAFPSVNVWVNPSNLGFGAGLNPILLTLLGDSFQWIWLLNNDTRAEPGTLESLLVHARQHSVAGAVGARLVDMEPPYAIQTWGGGRIGWWRGHSRHFIAQVPDERLDYLTGASMLLRTEALRQTGLFDPRYFLYWEDVDLCLRLRACHWCLTVAPEAIVRHRLSGSTGEASPRKDELINASAVRFFRKHGPLGGWPAIVTGVLGRVARRLLRGDLAAARAVWRGAITGFRD